MLDSDYNTSKKRFIVFERTGERVELYAYYSNAVQMWGRILARLMDKNVKTNDVFNDFLEAGENDGLNLALEKNGIADVIADDEELSALRYSARVKSRLVEKLLLSRNSRRRFIKRLTRAVHRAPVYTRSRSRSRTVRRAGRHVSRSFVAVAADSGGGDDGGGDGDGQSDCDPIAFAHSRKAHFVVLSARLGGLSLNGHINSIATRQRALPAQFVARSGGRFFIPFWRWAA